MHLFFYFLRKCSSWVFVLIFSMVSSLLSFFFFLIFVTVISYILCNEIYSSNKEK